MTTRLDEAVERHIDVPLDGIVLRGDLVVPQGARGIVVFAHGSGSSRLSPRNRAVAATLHAGGHATLLLDLLTVDEERVDARTREHRFDIALLADRLLRASVWVRGEPEVRELPLGYFGASTGAAAALVAAGRLGMLVHAVVSRGGRPDLAGAMLAAVRAPTLLIVGEADPDVLTLNREAFAQLRCPKALEVIPGATHLFEEQGTLERAAHLATAWFDRYFAQHVREGEGRSAGSAKYQGDR